MTRFVLSPRAQADIDHIWDYTATDGATTKPNAILRTFDMGSRRSLAIPAGEHLAIRSAAGIANIQSERMWSFFASLPMGSR
jgi:hypothetical protein